MDEWYSALWEGWGQQGGGLNLGLKPQVGHNFEIGVKERSSKYLGLEANYFFMDINKEIYLNPVIQQNTNYDHTIHQGFEAEAHGYILDLIDLFLSYTYEKAYFVKGTFAGNEIPMVPRHKLSAGLDLDYMDCLNVNYLMNFIGQRRFISDQGGNVPRLKAYATHDVKISYQKHGLEIYAAMNNIFDEMFSEYGVTNATGSAQNYYPSPGRNYSAGASYKF